MALVIEWEGHRLQPRIYFTPRFLMFATDATLAVDGQVVARKGGLGLAETAVGSFEHQGQMVPVELRVGGRLGVFLKIPYTLKIAGKTVSRGTLRLERASTAGLVWLGLVGLLLLVAWVI